MHLSDVAESSGITVSSGQNSVHPEWNRAHAAVSNTAFALGVCFSPLPVFEIREILVCPGCHLINNKNGKNTHKTHCFVGMQNIN